MIVKRLVTIPLDKNLLFIRLFEAYDNVATVTTLRKTGNTIQLEIASTASLRRSADDITDVLIDEIFT